MAKKKCASHPRRSARTRGGRTCACSYKIQRGGTLASALAGLAKGALAAAKAAPGVVTKGVQALPGAVQSSSKGIAESFRNIAAPATAQLSQGAQRVSSLADQAASLRASAQQFKQGTQRMAPQDKWAQAVQRSGREAQSKRVQLLQPPATVAKASRPMAAPAAAPTKASSTPRDLEALFPEVFSRPMSASVSTAKAVPTAAARAAAKRAPLSARLQAQATERLSGLQKGMQARYSKVAEQAMQKRADLSRALRQIDTKKIGKDVGKAYESLHSGASKAVKALQTQQAKLPAGAQAALQSAEDTLRLIRPKGIGERAKEAILAGFTRATGKKIPGVSGTAMTRLSQFAKSPTGKAIGTAIKYGAPIGATAAAIAEAIRASKAAEKAEATQGKGYGGMLPRRRAAAKSRARAPVTRRYAKASRGVRRGSALRIHG